MDRGGNIPVLIFRMEESYTIYIPAIFYFVGAFNKNVASQRTPLQLIMWNKTL